MIFLLVVGFLLPAVQLSKLRLKIYYINSLKLVANRLQFYCN